jgi:hypothetical protein
MHGQNLCPRYLHCNLDSELDLVWLRRVDEIISKDFTNPPSKTEVGARCFPTQCYVDVYKGQLYFWIIRIIADNSEKVSGARFRCCPVDGHFLRQQL